MGIRFSILLLLMLCRQVVADVTVTYDYGGLPDIDWQTYEAGPLFTEPSLPGGVYRQAVATTPDTMRRFGPGTDTYVAYLINRLQMPLLARHPNNQQLLPMLCRFWFIDKPNNHFYCQIDAEAEWSDGVSVTTKDIAFSIEFLTNPATQAETQKNALLAGLNQLVIFSEKAFSFQLTPPFSEKKLEQAFEFRPAAAHFYSSKTGWPEAFDLIPEPTTSAYHIETLITRNQINLRKTENWWANERAFFANRFNVDRIIYQKLKSAEILLKRFQAGEYDSIPLQKTNNWNNPAISNLANHYQIARLEFKSDKTTSRYAIWQWLKLPGELGAASTEDVLNPYEPTYGGAFWIDQQRRIDILARPQNSDNKAALITNINEAEQP